MEKSGDATFSSDIVIANERYEYRGPFLKSPETFRAHFGDIILFVSSRQRRLKARNFTVIFIFIPFTTY